jgi:hypothetical protein
LSVAVRHAAQVLRRADMFSRLFSFDNTSKTRPKSSEGMHSQPLHEQKGVFQLRPQRLGAIAASFA